MKVVKMTHLSVGSANPLQLWIVQIANIASVREYINSPQ